MNEALPDFQVPDLSPAQCAILARSRDFKLYKLNRASLLAGSCPFCRHNPATDGDIIAENASWWAKYTPSPEKNSRLHILIMHRQHIRGVMEYAPGDGDLLVALLKELYEQHELIFAGLMCRDGDARLSAGTIEHVHWHLMVPDGKGRLESPFYKGDESEREGLKRAIVYEKLVQGADPESLTEDERELVKGRI